MPSSTLPTVPEERLRLRWLIATSAVLTLAGAAALGGEPLSASPLRSPAAQEAAEHFEKHVRPIFIEHCVECHSGDKPKGGLRLDSAEGIRSGAYGDPIVEAGDLDASTLIEAVRYEDPLYAMPPKGKLADDNIAALERWVELGGTVPDSIQIDESDLVRWSLAPPTPLPMDLLPKAESGEGASDWIDGAITARLTAAGIEPSPPADRGNWLRRVTFDLTGLPPTPDEWRAYMATDGGRAAKEATVDRLLASPAFGERWARRWLDLVRYAETRAHEFDYQIPNAYQYRDYVIRAFDADVPYDRFITEFLAGDLVEEPRLDPTGTFDESVLGTGAWFLGEEVHSPVDPRGDQADRIAHQIEVVSKSVIGLGVACARCHDHKFDPISAEDYHALGGFALSTAARLVRFETNDHNSELGTRLRAFLEDAQPAAKGAVAGALRRESEGLAELLPIALRTADATRNLAATTAPAPDAIRALDARFADVPSLARPTILIEDFEAVDLSTSPLAPWERTGDAFLDRPVRAADTKSQTRLRARGLGSLNSYAGHADDIDPDQPFSADRFLGTLTSAPFPAARRYLHFLINGGDGPGVRVEVLLAESGEVIGAVHGRKDDAYSPARFDLGEHPDELIRLRLVDEESGGWGQIGADQIVLSDSEDASALEAPLSLSAWTALAEHAARSPRLLDWVQLLNESSGAAGRGPLAWLRSPPQGVSEPTAPNPAALREPPLVDYGRLTGPAWITNGPGFGTAPWEPGSIILDATEEDATIASILGVRSAVAHPMWSDLSLAPGTAPSRGGSFNWVQAGRTLHSPTFVSEHGRLAHLVRGRAKSFLVITGHKMISGPLHKPAIRTIDTRGGWRWVEQNAPTSAGLRSHMEFTALGASATFEVAATIDLAPGEPLPPPPLSGDWFVERPEELAEENVSLETLEGRAILLANAVRDAADLVENGGVPGRIVSDTERASLLSLADTLTQEHPGIRSSIASDLSGLARALTQLKDQRALVSALAPAAIDLEGVDEHILDRGSWRSPGAAAPRRAPSALRASNDPLALNGQGSGRLKLARSLLASPTKIVQRVWVNRLWRAMFARGLVTTPDDFGAMGANPSHPEILDQLSLDFEQDGWSTKRLLRRLALSDAYGRSTAPTPSSLEKDPLNALLARMHVRRLEAEEIRDALLAASGELDPERFGPPVPIHLTGFMKGRGRPGRSGPLDGAGRRSIYLEVRRNFPHPFLTVFDWPSPSTCRGKRSSSNVPAQALTLLNDPFVEERAAHLAEDLLAQPGSTEERIESLWLRVLGRLPSSEERGLAAGFSLAGADDAASWTDLTHVLFNVKGFLFLR